jgi:carbamoyltransferase
MLVLGINAYHGDASAALFRDGRLIAAVEEERFTRVKHAGGFPARAVRWCLESNGVRPEELDHVVISRKRSAHIVRKAVWALRLPHLALGRPRTWKRFGDIQETLAHALDVPTADLNAELHFVEHHVAHVASSFYSSPFKDAALLSLDGLGDFSSMLWGTGRDTELNIEGYVFFPHSLGFYYSAITQYLGMWKYGDEYKTMGLASYGRPKYAEEFQRIAHAGHGMDFKLGLRYFTHHRDGVDMTFADGEPSVGKLFSDRLERDLGPARKAGAPVEEHHQDVASSLQWQLEEIVLTLIDRLHSETGLKDLCYAGGVAFNCVANGKVRERTPFEGVYIHPAAGDAGLAVGAAQYVYHHVLGHPRVAPIDHAYWGPEDPPDRIKEALDDSGLSYRELDVPALAEETAKRIADGKVVGWYQGRSEWGPRALGNRSIVVDPRRADMKDTLNQRIKHRETFRPFSPSILEESVGDWFESDAPSPFMQMTYPVREEKRELIPAPTHVDGTGRLQTVSRDTNPAYHELISAFDRLTGVPVLLNTSFNESEPIVNSPEQALDCFGRTGMDALVMGPYLIG